MSTFKKTNLSDKMITADDRRIRRRNPNAPPDNGDIVGHTTTRMDSRASPTTSRYFLNSVSPGRMNHSVHTMAQPTAPVSGYRQRSISPRTDQVPVPIAPVSAPNLRSTLNMSSTVRSNVGRTAASPTRQEITEASRRHQRLLENVEHTIRNHEEVWEHSAECTSANYKEATRSLQEQVHTLTASLQQIEAARAEEHRVHARNTKEWQQHITELKEQLRTERELAKNQTDGLQHENTRLRDEICGLEKHIESLEDDMRTLYTMYQQSTADLEHLAERLQKFENR